MLILRNVSLLCDSCGEELRFVDGCAITTLDLFTIYNAHRCHSGHWPRDVVDAAPLRFIACRPRSDAPARLDVAPGPPPSQSLLPFEVAEPLA
jgi:hypothetical protein